MSIIKIDDWVEKNGISIEVFSEPKPMTYPYPKTIDDVGNLFSEIIFKPPRRNSNRTYCAYLKDISIFSDGGLFDYSLRNQIEGFDGAGIPPYDNITIDNAIYLASRWGATNYWHWMAESLARLSLIKEKPDDVKYVINSIQSPFVKESLMTMGVDPKKCIEIDKSKSIICKHLILPSRMNDFDKDGLLFLRDKIKRSVVSDELSPKRIYISRKKTRSVENETEVMELLSRYGFVMVRCEELSFEDQVKKFYNAEVVVAPHGAGNTNLLFAKDNAKLLELRSPTYFGRTYYYLCNHLGFDYYSLYGRGKIPTTAKESSSSLQSNMNIDVLRLNKTLEFMGVKQ